MEKIAKNRKNFICEKCYYNTCNKYDYEKHLKTEKHKKQDLSIKSTQKSQKSQKIATPVIVCVCGKSYADKSGLWRHKKKCLKSKMSENTELTIIQNEEKQKQMVTDIIKTTVIEILKNCPSTINNSINNNVTNNNKSFNLNVFLNETCKDAMNLDDFVNSIKIDLNDLEKTGEKGYVEGISSIFIKNLNELEQHLRPLHCSDSKREVLYIKNNNEWIKEQDDKPILTKAIKTIAQENIKQIKSWTEKYPECKSYHSKKNDTYLQIVSNSMNGLTDEECLSNIHKIISNISKQVTIQKYPNC